MSADRADQVTERVAEIEAYDRAECLDRWKEMSGRPPPKYLSPQFMKRVLIWEAQNRALGGVSAKTTRRLNRIATGRIAPTIAKPGSHLVREWNGRTYLVEVTNSGYVMDGKSWRSLSAIARHITGAHWSGPRFFGVQ
ncbi:DUF2924 domain-containing protein [uncultured Roseobacter sp.]|uniref:DUF2924 domain-containing protein n=1 Tax=uncultured Roseobacter sp. TaxID=114847 RepID=UPI0026278619|nr:DUF2924 domain-containing protein [uncultured Roseobacter sp.]